MNRPGTSVIVWPSGWYYLNRIPWTTALFDDCHGPGHIPCCHTGAFILGWVVSEFSIQLLRREPQLEHELPQPGAARGFLGTAGPVLLPISQTCRKPCSGPHADSGYNISVLPDCLSGRACLRQLSTHSVCTHSHRTAQAVILCSDQEGDTLWNSPSPQRLFVSLRMSSWCLLTLLITALHWECQTLNSNYFKPKGICWHTESIKVRVEPSSGDPGT